MHTILWVIVFSFVFFSSHVLNRILLKFSSNLGVRNNQISILRWSEESKPSVGGISFFLIFLVSTLFYFSLDYFAAVSTNFEVFGIIFSGILAFIMGLSDDAYNTTPMLKFIVQVGCSLGLIFSGVYVQIFESQLINYMITVVWVVGMMNSLNMLDNMDAITTITSIFILLTALLFHIQFINEINFLQVVMFTTLSSLISFLSYNWHPSKMFMGDNGSQFLGFFLSVVGVKYFWNLPVLINQNETSFSFVIVFLVYLIPLTDTTSVSINRVIKGNSPFVGGKDHTTHHLSYLGLTDSAVAIIFVFIALIASISSYLILISKNSALVYGLFILNFAIAISLFLLTKRTKPVFKEFLSMNLDSEKAVKNLVKKEKKIQSEYNEA